MATKPKQVKKRRWLDILMSLLLIAGVAIALYPFVSDKINQLLDQQLISYYQRQANQLEQQERQKIAEQQKTANQQLAREGLNPGRDPFSTARTAKKTATSSDYYQEHTIGVIQIPKIKVKLPIFDQTTDLFLQKGATLLAGTSFPTGEVATHSVISAHRGLPEAKLFTDLPQLELGDLFYVETHQQTHAYQVDQIKVILPTETDSLQIDEDATLITLMTCTPYMINSHRLLVRGHRIAYEPTMQKSLTTANNHRRLTQLLTFLTAGLVLLVVSIFLVKKWRHKS